MKKSKILLVEDEAIIAMKEVKILEKHNYTVKVAYSGEEAIYLTRKDNAIDLILMDIDLGSGIDGTETARELLRIHELPIVFLTSHSEKEMVDKVRQITRYGYVLKNSGEFVLISSINMALDLFEAHQKTRDIEQQFIAFMQHIPAAVFIKDEKIRTKFVNKHMLDNFIGDHEWYNKTPSELFSPEIGTSMEQDSKDAIIHGSKELEEQVITREGTEKIYKTVKFAIPQENGVKWVGGISWDITEQKNYETALAESENKYRNFIKYSSEGIYRVDIIPPVSINLPDEEIVSHINTYSKVAEVNNTLAEMYGLEPEDMIGRYAIEFAPDYGERSLLVIKNQNNQVTDIETHDFDKNGNDLWLIENIHGEIVNGELTRLWGVQRDNTERKRIEEALQDNETKYRTLFESSSDALVLLDPENGYIDCNNSALELFEVPSVEVFTRLTPVDISPEYQEDGTASKEKAQLMIETALEYGVAMFEWIHQTMSGKTFYATVLANKIELNNKILLLGTVRDTTQKKMANKELEKTTLLLESVVTQAPVPIAIADKDATILFINPACKKQLGVEDEPEMVPGVNLLELTPSWKDYDKDGNPILTSELPLAKSLQGIITNGLEIRVVRKDGSEIWEKVSAVPVYNSNNELIAGMVMFPDITGQKTAESNVKKLLEEKELILKEVHHRVKNNMNIVASLLQLQADRIADEQAKNVILDANNRINSMMLIYENLYRKDDYSYINAKSFILSLIESIYVSLERLKNVIITDDIDDLKLDTKIIYPLSIIINELITNAFKHAFNAAENGEIIIRLFKNNPNEFILSVIDNGSGLPESVDTNGTKSFGLFLVNVLAKQLNGTITIERNNGTNIEICVPVPHNP